MADERYYVRRPTGEILGPFSLNQMRSSAAAGKLPKDVEVSSDDGETWQFARKVPALLMTPEERELRADYQQRTSGAGRRARGRAVGAGGYAASRRERRKWDDLGPEGLLARWGIPGGIILIALGAVWFFAGLNAGYIYYWPPAMAVLGMIAIINGVLDSKSAQRRRRAQHDARRRQAERHGDEVGRTFD